MDIATPQTPQSYDFWLSAQFCFMVPVQTPPGAAPNLLKPAILCEAALTLNLRQVRLMQNILLMMRGNGE
jgi:hypothetical protein